MFRIPVIPKTKKTTSTVNNIAFDPSLKRFCMRDVCNLKYVGKLECISHKPLFLALFAAIVSVTIFVVISVHFTDQSFEICF